MYMLEHVVRTSECAVHCFWVHAVHTFEYPVHTFEHPVHTFENAVVEDGSSLGVLPVGDGGEVKVRVEDCLDDGVVPLAHTLQPDSPVCVCVRVSLCVVCVRLWTIRE